MIPPSDPVLLFLDYETASEVNLRKAGAHVYASHPSTRVLMLSWAFNDEPFSLWEPHKSPLPPQRLVRGLQDPGVLLIAANAAFERLITALKMGIQTSYERWRCVLVMAYYLGFAGTLDDVLSQIGLRNKDPRGKSLIDRFCSPAGRNHKVDWYDWSNRPEEWENFGEYCIQDGEVERDLFHWLRRYPTMLGWDWRQWFIDQEINDRGVPVDVEFAEAAIRLWARERERLTYRMKEVTGLPVVSRDPVMSYINQRIAPATPFECMRKDYIASRLSEPLSEHVREVLELWQAKEAKAATKYAAVARCVSPDGRVRGMFQYKGASRTDRAAGRRLQLQNLKRPLAKTSEDIKALVAGVKTGDTSLLEKKFGVGVSGVLGGAVRHIIRASPGCKLVVADLTSIESVILGWLTNCEAVIRTFRSGKDSYRVFGTRYYGVPYDDITPAQRSFCKPAVLGCGFMLGAIGLVAYAAGQGVEMSVEEAQAAVDTFRQMYPEIPAFWRWINEAVKMCVRTGQPSTGYRLRVERDADFLRIRLPSGRNLSYFKPEVVWIPAPWDPSKEIENFAYMGMNDKRQWVRITAHAGGITENIIQSIALDVLQGGIVNAHDVGLPIVLQAHDELGAEVYTGRAEEALDLLIKGMTQPPAWGPDLWLGASGMIVDEYTKD